MTEQALDWTSHQPLGYTIEIDEVISQVKNNSIRADPDERHGPFLPLPDFDHLVKRPNLTIWELYASNSVVLMMYRTSLQLPGIYIPLEEDHL